MNDLLMAIFFYVVALEVKRELLFGSLRDRASAAVPVARPPRAAALPAA